MFKAWVPCPQGTQLWELNSVGGPVPFVLPTWFTLIPQASVISINLTNNSTLSILCDSQHNWFHSASKLFQGYHLPSQVLILPCPSPSFTEQDLFDCSFSFISWSFSSAFLHLAMLWLVAGHANQRHYLIALVMSADMRLKVRIYLKCLGTSGYSFFTCLSQSRTQMLTFTLLIHLLTQAFAWEVTASEFLPIEQIPGCIHYCAIDICQLILMFSKQFCSCAQGN